MERITVMLEPEIAKKLRNRQADTIRKENRSYSFSHALNDALRDKL